MNILGTKNKAGKQVAAKEKKALLEGEGRDMELSSGSGGRE
jgi:hypothetical protein